jgi:hypothetical protein
MRRLLLSLACALGLAAAAPAAPDPLAKEIARASAALETVPATDPLVGDLRASVGPILERARAALLAGRRHQALHLYAQAYEPVAAAGFLRARSTAERADLAAFEAAWKKGEPARAVRASAFADLRPALVRALAEAAAAQAPVLYDASLNYGRSTTPDSGFYYLEAARAEQDLPGVLRRLQETPSGAPPPVRDIGAEIDALRGELLEAYRPPASIDRHGEFISASSALKEAKELNAAGLHHGALLRYLQGALRVGRLRAPAALVAPALPAGVDHSIARAFVEAATAAAASSDEERRRTTHAVTDTVLPRFRYRPAALPASDRARVVAGVVSSRPRGHGDARALALHLKPRRSSRSAGRERRAGIGRSGAVRGRELRRVRAGEAFRRHAVPGHLRGRRAGGDAERLRLLW